MVFDIWNYFTIWLSGNIQSRRLFKLIIEQYEKWEVTTFITQRISAWETAAALITVSTLPLALLYFAGQLEAEETLAYFFEKQQSRRIKIPDSFLVFASFSMWSESTHSHCCNVNNCTITWRAYCFITILAFLRQNLNLSSFNQESLKATFQCVLLLLVIFLHLKQSRKFISYQETLSNKRSLVNWTTWFIKHLTEKQNIIYIA